MMFVLIEFLIWDVAFFLLIFMHWRWLSFSLKSNEFFTYEYPLEIVLIEVSSLFYIFKYSEVTFYIDIFCLILNIFR